MAKSLKIADLIDRTNDMLKNSPDDARQDGIIIHAFVSDLLHKSKVYAGFNYLQPYGPGCDSSRTYFHKHRSL